MTRYQKIGRQFRRYQKTEFMTVVIKRPPKNWKIWKVIALENLDSVNSWDCEVLATYPAAFDPTPKV